MMTPHDALVAGRELLSDPEHWTKGVLARTKNGSSTSPYDDKATCFCTIGAVHRVAGIGNQALKRSLTNHLISAMEHITGDSVITIFNDRSNTTHAQLLAVWDKAIALAHH